MNLKILVLAIFPIFLQLGTYGNELNLDSVSTVLALEIGDKIPDIYYPAINSDNDEINILNYSGKWVLLDFWSSYCVACLELFPKMERLQADYSDKLKVLLVNSSESLDKINMVLERLKKVKNQELKLPILYGSELLSKQFQHRSVPFYVLISPEGLVIANPRSEEITETNLQALFSEGKVNFSKGAFQLLDFERDKPLFVAGNAGNGEDIINYAVLSKRVEGLPTGHQIYCDSSNSLINAFNYSIKDLYGLAFFDGYKSSGDYDNTENIGMRLAWLPDSRIILDVKDTSYYVSKLNGEYKSENTYTFQLIAKPGTDYKQLQSLMQSQLRGYFGLHARMERRTIPCLVLRADDPNIFKSQVPDYSKGGKKMMGLGMDHNGMFSQFIFNLFYGSRLLNGPPLVDETNIKGYVKIYFEADRNDYRAINKALKKYKMSLTLENRETDILVLSDN